MYNVKNLVENNYDFSVVFPEKQASIRENTGLDFNLPEIVAFLQQQTNNFTIESTIAKDLDEAIFKIVKKYKEEIGEKEQMPEPQMPEQEQVPDREEDRQLLFFALDSFEEGDQETFEYIKMQTELGGLFDDEEQAMEWYKENGFDYKKFN
jgi:hypothetical protein